MLRIHSSSNFPFVFENELACDVLQSWLYVSTTEQEFTLWIGLRCTESRPYTAAFQRTASHRQAFHRHQSCIACILQASSEPLKSHIDLGNGTAQTGVLDSICELVFFKLVAVYLLLRVFCLRPSFLNKFRPSVTVFRTDFVCWRSSLYIQL